MVKAANEMGNNTTVNIITRTNTVMSLETQRWLARNGVELIQVLDDVTGK